MSSFVVLSFPVLASEPSNAIEDSSCIKVKGVFDTKGEALVFVDEYVKSLVYNYCHKLNDEYFLSVDQIDSTDFDRFNGRVVVIKTVE